VADGPLSDITVLDLTRALAGPHAAMMLGDLGARVIKIETPGHGDDTRGWGPPFVTGPSGSPADTDDPVGDDTGAPVTDGTADSVTGGTANSGTGGTPDQTPISTYFLSCNRNKESVTLDLKSDRGREALTELVRRCDVLLENFRPGVLDRLGFGLARLMELNPGLVVLSISGFGHDGPEGGRAGYDQIAQGEAGLMSMTGPDPDTPTKVGVPISDLLSGMYGAFGVLGKLHERSRTGRGGLVRTSLLAAVVGVHAYQGTRWTVAGEIPRAEGPHHPSICPYGLFHASDGIVQISVGSENLWRKFAAAFDLPVDAPGFASNPERVRNAEQVRAAVDAAFARFTTVDLLARLAEVGVPSGQVKNLQQVYEWEQTRSQGLLIDVDHPVLGTVTLPGPPLRFFDGDGAEWHRAHTAPPLLGQHTGQVLEWLGTPADHPQTEGATP
jgi:crotonobetainyl-CoA:carnitine CoA-transferase CaiB-like acyl-CoA transferase